MPQATLFVVGTPIGNLADMTSRAIQTLKQVDLIACEDTRHTRILLDHYGIDAPTVSYHQHSSLQKIDWLLEQLKMGKSIALVTDAGTPGISDPGGVLVERVHLYNRELTDPGQSSRGGRGFKSGDGHIEIVSLPGPSALAAGLSIAGMRADHFLFLGFLPKKKGRQSLLAALKLLDKALATQTVVFFESAVRIHQTLIDFERVFGEKSQEIEICLGRELTKKFEEVWRGTLVEAVLKTQELQRGEFVVVLDLSHKR